jgi:hypothetical protein
MVTNYVTVAPTPGGGPARAARGLPIEMGSVVGTHLETPSLVFWTHLGMVGIILEVILGGRPFSGRPPGHSPQCAGGRTGARGGGSGDFAQNAHAVQNKLPGGEDVVHTNYYR